MTSEPWFIAAFAGLVVSRALYCPACAHKQTWVEGVSETGQPNGAVADGPWFDRGREAERFLEEHSKAVA